MDLTDAQREAARVAQVLENIADGVYALDPEWRFAYLNAAAEQLLGRPRHELLDVSLWDAFPTAEGSDFGRALRRAVELDETVELDVRSPALDSWFALRVHPTVDGITVHVRNIDEQRAAEVERQRLEQLRHAAAERAARIGEVAAALTEAANPADVARLVLVHAIDALSARGGALALFVDGTDALRWSAVEGYPTQQAETVWASPLDIERPITRVVSSRLPEFVSSPDEMAKEFPAVADLFASTGDRAVCSLPLIAGGRCLGGLTLSFTDERTFGVEDRLLLAALTDVSAQALERARLFEQEHRVAVTLQRALLPDRLADADGVLTAARYLPGTEGVAVGGDWYDVFALDDHRLGIVLGDVAGKGVGAAGVMGRLRNALRAFATSIDGPAAVLSRVDDFAARFGQDDLATVVYGVLDIGTGELRLSSAGHLPPVLVDTTGATRLLQGEPDLPLGVNAGHERHEHRVRLRAGDSLFLYSDGLVENRTRSIDDGLTALTATIAPLYAVDVDAACTAVVYEMVGDAGGDDDVAVLVLRWDGPPADERCHIVLPADVASARRARALVTEELDRWDESALIETATLCISEVVTNAVVHAGTPIRLDIILEPAFVRIEVSDGGSAPPERLDADVDAIHGRGIAIVEHISSAWGVEPTETGKCVWFVLERAMAAAP